MNGILANVNWAEQEGQLSELLKRENELETQSMDQGFEAEVIRVNCGSESFVLKMWNRSSRPDVGFQYKLLQRLYDRGLAVSRPIGWGSTAEGAQVLLTSFDGLLSPKVKASEMKEYATILAGLHDVRAEELDGLSFPAYSFLDYFFYELDEHQDLKQALDVLTSRVSLRQDRLIHGDYHLPNVLKQGERYTVIDWTNAQWGDPRYDFAWSLLLLRLYGSERYAQAFAAAYLAIHPVPDDELKVFDGLACLRWLRLSRSDGVLQGPKIWRRMNQLLAEHPELAGLELNKRQKNNQ